LSWIPVLGWTGQGLYFGRSLLQWAASERAGRSVVPAGFWPLSLGGAVLLLSYALLRGDGVIALGQTVNLAIYLRNFWIERHPTLLPLRRRLLALALVTFGAGVAAVAFHDLHEVHSVVLALGWTGQLLFLTRFPVQWWHAERRGRAELPPGFWWLSLSGAALVLVYAAAGQDWPIAVGQAVGLLAYARNLRLGRGAEVGE